MCGICGIVDFADGRIDAAGVARMVEVIRHRGPDDMGVYTSGGVGLGHARLSIIDLSDSGHQPMVSHDGKCALVYNGEIYNYLELKRCLEEKGHHFFGHSDTETVLNAYLEWGVNAFCKFEGMFAMALWDDRAKELYLARDRFGIKPLYYLKHESVIVFGSEVKSLLASGRVKKELNWSALHEYLHYGVALGGSSFFDGVRKLLPGTCLTADRDGCRVVSYASIYNTEPVDDDFSRATNKVRDLLDRAVARHLISDVPVGVFLSGGIDSAAMTALASKHCSGRLQTFSAGFDFDKGVNELPRARVVAEHFGTEHHELKIAGKSMPDIFERLVRCHDEPFGDTANIPLYLLCEEVKGSIKVVLQGDGGDEVFAGYHRYSRLAQERLWSMVSRLAFLAKPLFSRRSVFYRALRTLYAFGHEDPSLRMALLMSQEFFDYPPEQVFSAEARKQLAQTDPFARYREFYERFKNLDSVQRMLYTDSGIILPDTYFEKVDKSTMAHGIEVRVPMVDTNLADYVMRLPASFKVRGGQKKYILRKALRGVLPDAVLDWPKTGFGVPFQYWFRGPMADYLRSVLLDHSVLDWGLFDCTAIERCMKEHITGDRDNGFLLNKLLNLALWHGFYLK